MNDTETVTQENYVIGLRDDQWDLIVLAMQHIRGMTLGADSAYAIDRLGRKFLLRRCDEIIKDIQAVCEGAGK